MTWITFQSGSGSSTPCNGVSTSRPANSVASRVRMLALRNEFFTPQFLDEPRIACDHDAQQWLGIEAGAGQKAQFFDPLRRHFLRFVNEQHRAATTGFEMVEPALAQGFEPRKLS